nr:MAG TPA: hypothetical protein [Caudoviricetes sp.]
MTYSQFFYYYFWLHHFRLYLFALLHVPFFLIETIIVLLY